MIYVNDETNLIRQVRWELLQRQDKIIPVGIIHGGIILIDIITHNRIYNFVNLTKGLTVKPCTIMANNTTA